MAAATAVQGKKGKKKAKNTKTLSLNDFLGDSASPGVVKQMDWADEAEEEFLSVNNSFTYQSTSSRKTITLPTAPKASRSVEVDASRISDTGPFTAFVGNLPYETDQETLQTFFKDLPIASVRLPEENGRFKGFGYVEFEDKMSLVKALEMNEEVFQRRTIRVDIAENQNKGSAGSWTNRGGERYGSGSGPDPTAGNWRSAPRQDFSSNRSSFDQRDNYHGRMDERHGGGGYGDYRYGDRYGDQRRQRNDGYYDRGQRSSYHRGSSHDQDGGWRRDSQGYNQDRQYSDERQSNSRYGGRDRYGSGGGYDRDSYNKSGYGSRGGFDRQRSGEDWNRREEREAPRERPQLKLQPRQKPLDDSKAAPDTRSSIFGGAKPVDTSSREKAIEEKLHQEKVQEKENVVPEKKSANIFGSAKPVDTAAREREIEAKIALQEQKSLEKVQQKSPPPTKSVSVFGNAKPVDTASRDRLIEDKIKRQEQAMLGDHEERPDGIKQRSRRSSEKSDDHQPKSPTRRSRTSSTRSVEDQEGAPTHHGRERKASANASEARKPEFKPAPVPKQSAWGKKMVTENEARETNREHEHGKASSAEPTSNAWSRGAPKYPQHGEREEAEGNSREDEEKERTPEGAADDDQKHIRPRGDPGDGREENSQHRSATYSSNRNHTSRDNRKYDGKASNSERGSGGGNRQYGRQYSNDNRHRDRDFHSNRRRGDGDSESSKTERRIYSDRGQASRPRRDNRGSKSDWSETKRDSSGDSRPECDRPNTAGQEQAPKGKKSSRKPTPSAPPVIDDTPVNFATQSKFALLAIEDSGDDNDNDDATAQ